MRSRVCTSNFYALNMINASSNDKLSCFFSSLALSLLKKSWHVKGDITGLQIRKSWGRKQSQEKTQMQKMYIPKKEVYKKQGS